MSVLVLGTVALDTVKTPFGKKKHMLGGSAVHFAMSARLFTKVNLVAIVGEDFPAKHIDFLNRKGINSTSIVHSRGKSFRWEGEYNGDMNVALTIKTELGVLLEFLPQITHEQKRIKYLFLANVDPDIQCHLLEHMHSPRLTALDSMNFWINHKRASLLKLLKRVDIYVANDQEARLLTGEHTLLKTAQRLRSMGPKMVLIKKGEHGVLFYSDSFIFSLPAYPVDTVIDPTGAGDTFAGGFMGYLTKVKKIDRLSIKRAIAYGTVAASFNVQDFGTQRTARLRFLDLEARLNTFRKIIMF